MKPENLTSNAEHVRKAVRDAAAAVLSYPRSSLNPYNIEAWSDAIAERVAAELAAPASAPVLSAEDRAAAQRFVAWAVNDSRGCGRSAVGRAPGRCRGGPTSARR